MSEEDLDMAIIEQNIMANKDAELDRLEKALAASEARAAMLVDVLKYISDALYPEGNFWEWRSTTPLLEYIDRSLSDDSKKRKLRTYGKI